jgi:hypothetical protein
MYRIIFTPFPSLFSCVHKWKYTVYRLDVVIMSKLRLSQLLYFQCSFEKIYYTGIDSHQLLVWLAHSGKLLKSITGYLVGLYGWILTLLYHPQTEVEYGREEASNQTSHPGRWSEESKVRTAALLWLSLQMWLSLRMGYVVIAKTNLTHGIYCSVFLK